MLTDPSISAEESDASIVQVKSSCGSAACSAFPIETAVYTTPLILPFSRPLISDPISQEPEPLERPNYHPYDLFAFNTRFAPLLRDISTSAKQTRPSYQVVSKEYQERMVLTIELYRLGKTMEFVSLSPEEARVYQLAIDRAASEHQKECLLLTVEDLRAYPLWWVTEIIPFLTWTVPAVYDDGWYVTLNPLEDYRTKLALLQRTAQEKIKQLYHSGAVVCHPRLDQGFIDRWQLIPLDVSMGTELQIYILPGPVRTPALPWIQILANQRDHVTDIYFLLPQDHPVAKHILAVMFSRRNIPFVLSFNEVKTEIRSLEQYQQIFRLLDQVSGEIIRGGTLERLDYTSSLEETYSYGLQDLPLDSHFQVVYKQENLPLPWVISTWATGSFDTSFPVSSRTGLTEKTHQPLPRGTEVSEASTGEISSLDVNDSLISSTRPRYQDTTSRSLISTAA